MKRLKTLAVFCAIAGVLLGAAAAKAATPPLNDIPKDSEVIVAANARQIIDSDLFKTVYAAAPQVAAAVQGIENMSGVDLLKNVDFVMIYGRMNDKPAGGVIFQGQFDTKKLLTLVTANPQYKTETVDGQQVHEWLDAKENRVKYGVILSDGTVIIYNSHDALMASLAAIKDNAQSFASTPEAAALTGKPALQLLVINRRNEGPAAKYHLAAAGATLDLSGADAQGQLTIAPQASDDAAKWADLLKGAAAFGQLQPDNAQLHELAAKAAVATSSDGKSVTLTVSVPQAQLAAAISEKMKSKEGK